MSTDAIILAQWLSPAYPVGAFAYSHGLEAAVQSGAIADGPQLEGWLRDIAEHGSGRNDCILLFAAYDSTSPQALRAVNDTGRAIAASAERLQEGRLQGAAFGKVTADIWGGALEGLLYPVAVGAAAARQSLDRGLTAELYLHSMLGNLVSAAQRLMGLGQTDAQRMIADLAQPCMHIAAQTARATLDDLHSTAFLSDIAAMHHETCEPRIFRT